MTDFYQNDKNSQNNSSGVHSDAELDSNHNQLNGKAVIDLMVKRDEAGQQMHVSFQLCSHSETLAVAPEGGREMHARQPGELT